MNYKTFTMQIARVNGFFTFCVYSAFWTGTLIPVLIFNGGKKMRKGFFIAGFILILSSGGQAFAQVDGQPDGPGNGPMMDGQGPHGYGNRMMNDGPRAHARERGDRFFNDRKFWKDPVIAADLELTKEQIVQLDESAAKSMKEMDLIRDDIARVNQEIRATLAAEAVDQKKVRELAASIRELKGKDAEIRLLAHAEIMGLLSPDQRARLDKMGPEFHKRRGRGYGPGYGRGYGPGYGPGNGPGYGPGYGPGRGNPDGHEGKGLGRCGCDEDCPNRRQVTE